MPGFAAPSVWFRANRELVMMPSSEIVKINSRPLESGELKRLDKQEKEGIAGVVAAVKGRQAGGRARNLVESSDADQWRDLLKGHSLLRVVALSEAYKKSVISRDKVKF